VVKQVRQAMGAGLLAAFAGLGFAQDFEHITRNVEIDFPESAGVFTSRPACGVPLPEPKTMKPELGWVELGHAGTTACTIVIHPDASATEKCAARELATQIAFLAGTTNRPEIVKAGTAVVTPVVCVLGVNRALFKGARVDIPRRHEGFAIKTGKWRGLDAVFVAAPDRFGVYWGVQTLKQMLYREEDPRNHGSIPPAEADRGRVLAPRGYCADWPDVQYRMSPRPGNRAVRLGRCNTTYVQLGSKRLLHSAEKYSEAIEDVHRSGFICVGSLGWLGLNGVLRDDSSRTNCPMPSREICPVADMPLIESIVRKAFEAGADGLSVNFDDVEPVANHHEKCPLCKPKFKSLADWQAFVLSNILSLARRNGWDDRLFICCPTDYYQLRLRTDDGLKSYFSTLCGFPGVEKVKFYHTAFVRTDRKRLADAGLKNYAWWNNGIWAAKNGELLGYDVGAPRMEYSWGLMDIAKDGLEKFFPERLAELRHLKGNADLVFSGTGGDFPPSIGSLFAWDTERFLFREHEYREWYIDGEGGKGTFDSMRVWEWATKPLAAKCLARGTLDKTDERRMEAARLSAEFRQASTGELERIKKYLTTRSEFSAACKDLAGVVETSAVFARQAGCLLSVGPATLIQGPVTPGAEAVELEAWSAPTGMDLNGCALVPASGSAPARLSATGNKVGLLTRHALGQEVGGFERLAFSCSLSRGTRLTAKVVVDGTERTTSTTGHGPDWQEMLLPLGGRQLDAFSLRLDLDPAIDKPAAQREALLRPVRLEPGRNGFDTVNLAQGKPLKFAEFNGMKWFFMATNKLVTAAGCFVLSRRSCSIEAEFAPVDVGNFKLAGTRSTPIASYTGLPGWALGVCWGKVTFTLEDGDGIVSTVAADRGLERYAACHVLAVRDFQNRKLRLYVNGRKVEVDEKGSGLFGDKFSNLGISFDPWAGRSLYGLLQYLRVYDRALSEDEARVRFMNPHASRLNDEAQSRGER
jgi:hypothetical protein